jgi:hypothetical protein
VPQQLADNRQPKASYSAEARVRVPQIVNAQTGKAARLEIEPPPRIVQGGDKGGDQSKRQKLNA